MLLRLIRHVLEDLPFASVAVHHGRLETVARRVAASRPSIVIYGPGVREPKIGDTLHALHQASPGSKVILVPGVTLSPASAPQYPVDSCLHPAELVRRLPRTVRRLSWT